MKSDFTLLVYAENNFSVLNRMINICNRRRVRIKRLLARELEDYHHGEACFILFTTPEMAEKIQLQIDKLIEVEQTKLLEGVESFHKESQLA